MDSNQEEGTNILERQLITSAEAGLEKVVKQNEEMMTGVAKGEGSAADVAIVENENSRENISEDPKHPSTTFVKVEKSLISLGFFTPSSRRIKDQKVKRITFTREIDGKRVEATAEFHPSPVYGLPITADQDKYLALHDIITNLLRTDGIISNPIRFTSAELLRLLNKRVRTGKNYKDISEWLDVMVATMIVSNGVVYDAGKKKYVRDRFHVFERVVTIGKELPDGTVADANYVWLSEWQLENINQKFVMPLDLLTYRELKNHIAKALVPLLQIWLFASHKKGSYEKRYDELCEMLSLQSYRTPSQILRQLKPSLDELTQYEYLAKWRIEKTADRKAYKIILFHGPKFHRDRRRRSEQKTRSEMPLVVGESEALEPELPQPGKLLPEDTRPESTDQLVKATADSQPNLVDDLAARGVVRSVAKKLLESISVDRHGQIRDYIEYWDKATNVGPGFLYDLIKNGNPLPKTFVPKRVREAREREAEQRSQRRLIKDLLESRYETYRANTIERYIEETLLPEEFERRTTQYTEKLSTESGSPSAAQWNRPVIFQHIARTAVREEIAVEANTLSFEDFRKQELPRILTELRLDRSEIDIDRAA